MKKHLGLLGLLIGLIGASHARAQETQKGVEVLTRGPIHEAFAEPSSANPRPNPIIHQKPPAAIEELPPDQKPEGDHVQWIPGYFAWDETGDDYIWISGLWRATPPGRQWMPGHWASEADGWQWVSGYWAVETLTEVEYLPQPPNSIDVGPSAAAPDADNLYAPGIWVYQERRYLWRPGFWYQARADWFYNPARYTCSPAGYIFSDGYWDYPLERRGMLFAPARFSLNVWATPGWSYQPRYALASQGLLSSLFVRPEFSRYYFGDYYAPEYNRQGFVPWFDHRLSVKVADPLFSYTRWNSRADAQWEANLRSVHQERLAGNAPRPPITLVQQNEFIQNITINKKVQIGTKTINVTDPQSVLRHMAMAAPLNKGEHKEFKLVPVTKAAALEQHQAAKNITTLAVERQIREAKIISQGVHPAKPTDSPARVKIEQPKNAPPVRVIRAEAPAKLELPKHVEQPIPQHEPIKPLRVELPKQKGKSPEPPKKESPKKDKASLQLPGEMFPAIEATVSVSANRPWKYFGLVAPGLASARQLL